MAKKILVLALSEENANRIGDLLHETQGNSPDNDEFFMEVISAGMAPLHKMPFEEAMRLRVPRHILVE